MSDFDDRVRRDTERLRRWDDSVSNIDERGADTYTCGDCGTVVRDGRGCPECEYGFAQDYVEDGGEA